MNPKTTGTCPGCWRKVNVQRGTIPRHSGAPGVRGARPCPASGQTWTPAIGAAAEEAERRVNAAPDRPDPCDFGALLAAAVAARRNVTGESETEIARAAGLAQSVLWKALRNPDARPSTVRAVCRLLGLRVMLVPAERGE